MSHIATQTTQGPAILIVDDMQFRRAGLVSLLRTWAEPQHIDVLGIDSETPIPLPSSQCRIVVLNVGRAAVADGPARSCIDSIRSQLPGAPLVIVSERDEQGEVLCAFQAGVQGFVPANLDPDMALQAIGFILNGGSFFPPAAQLARRKTGMAATFVPSYDRATEITAGDTLTARQRDVLDLLRQGKPNKLIARELRMCESTVKVHVRQIMRKLGAANRTQAALCATAPRLNGHSLKLPGLEAALPTNA
jgi:DNA-binding NarL/FixJ family response regulator